MEGGFSNTNISPSREVGVGVGMVVDPSQHHMTEGYVCPGGRIGFRIAVEDEENSPQQCVAQYSLAGYTYP
jgi:hypothetical protein